MKTLLINILLVSSTIAAPKVFTSYLWHLQQPNYWPEQGEGTQRYMFAADQLKGSPNWPGHPQSNLEEIFGKADRVAIYQWRSKSSVEAMTGPDAGAQITYPGDLAENVSSLARRGLLGYSPDWYRPIREGMQLKTSTGHPKLLPVGFSYHHALLPLIDKDARKKEIGIDRVYWKKLWG